MAAPKLNKQLHQGLSAAGIETITGEQEKIISRVLGGASLYVIPAENPGPGTANTAEERLTGLMIAILQKLNYSMPDTPRAIVIASTVEEATTIYEAFVKLAANMDLKIHLAHDLGDLDKQNMAIYAGADIVVATPKRLIKLYFQCGINVNKVGMLLLYNASRLIDARYKPEIDRFTDSLSKFQGLVYTESLNEKLKKACEKFMFAAQTVE